MAAKYTSGEREVILVGREASVQRAAAEAQPGSRRVTTLEMLSRSQIAAIKSIPPLDEMVLSSDTSTRPVSYFLSEETFRAEQDNIFRRVPVPIGPSGLLPASGSAVAHDLYGLPLLITRDSGGTVRAFLNACKHKGAKLVETEAACKAPRLVCPYHSWTYALDGKLIGIALPDCFTGIDKQDYGLSQLACREFGGLIWVVLDRSIEADFSDLVDELGEDLDHLGIGSAHVYDRQTFEIKANWKLVLEPFMENYHVRRLHRDSIGSLFKDTSSIIHKFGPHQRKLKPRGDFKIEMLDVAEANIHKAVNHVYQVFPNAVLITSPYYISLMTVIPKAVDRTTVEYFMLTPEAPKTAKAQDVMKRSFDLVLKVFGTEDFRAAEIADAGLRSGALEHVVYGGMENTIPSYYDQLDDYVARPQRNTAEAVGNRGKA